MESEARENQRITGEAEDASVEGAEDAMVETGIAVHQKTCAAERKIQGKARANGRIC